SAAGDSFPIYTAAVSLVEFDIHVAEHVLVGQPGAGSVRSNGSEQVPPSDVAHFAAVHGNDRQRERTDIRENLGRHQQALQAFHRAVSAGDPSNSEDRKSTRLNSSHVKITYAVFCLKKKRRRLSSPTVSWTW